MADFPEGSFIDLNNKCGSEDIRISNGAFQLKSWVINELIVMEKNLDYWDSHSVKLDAIHLFPIVDVAAEERAFRSGQLHITSKVPSGKVAWYRENDPTALRTDKRLGLFFLQLNQSVDPLHKVAVRKALAKSIDREQLVELVLKDGKCLPASWFLPPELMNRASIRRSFGI